MGKRIIQQRRGRGGPQYRSPSHRHLGEVFHPKIFSGKGEVIDLVHAPGRTSPVAKVDFDGNESLMIAAEGMYVGQTLTVAEVAEVAPGNVMELRGMPEGTPVYNVEAYPGDGGKFIRTAGTMGTIISRGQRVVVEMPSGVFKSFNPLCRAAVGIVAGSGRGDKPFGKAGAKYHAYRSKSKANFRVRGVAMNPVDHPHGGGNHQHVGKPSTVSRNAPPGRKVGRLSPQKKKRRN